MGVIPIILAAGGSTRMGRPKPLLEFDGKTALELVLEAHRGAGLARPIVVLGCEADAVRAAVKLDGVTMVVNAEWVRGQTSSLKAGLRALPADAEAFLVHPVDVPLVTSALVKSLVAAWPSRRPGASIGIPSHKMKRGHPVMFDAALKDEILAVDDAEPLRGVVNARERIFYVDAPEEALLDMDTPADYERCLARYRARR